jgi:hypothetical protein
MREERPGGDDRGSNEELAETERGGSGDSRRSSDMKLANMQQVSRKFCCLSDL